MEQRLEFINIKSHISKINPSLKIIYFLLYIAICCVSLHFNYILIPNFIFVTYLLISSKVPIKFYLNNIFKIFLLIIALYIIMASFSYTLLFTSLVALSVIFGVCLYTMIIYTTQPFDLALGIYDIVKHFNFLAINPNNIFISLYNLVYLRKDYYVASNNIIDALELKGINFRHNNIIARFFMKLNYLNDIFAQMRNIRVKRTNTIKRNRFDINNVRSNIHVVDIVYLGLFILLFILGISKVI